MRNNRQGMQERWTQEKRMQDSHECRKNVCKRVMNAGKTYAWEMNAGTMYNYDSIFDT